MEKIYINDYKFIKAKNGKAEFIFSTASGGLNFNKNFSEGIENIHKIKEWFKIKEIGFLNQTHSDLIYSYNGEVYDGDALITDKRNIAIGIFTADCVPVLLYDSVNGVVAAIHSGWRGTLLDICGNTVEKMRLEYSVNPKDLIAYIGPHNKSCCYEIGEDVAEKFINEPIYEKLSVVNNGKLNLERCIIKGLLDKGVIETNINLLNICTYCSKEEKFHSYRKNKYSEGRLFSFIFLNE